MVHTKEVQTMAVITISRVAGSAGDEVARRVCELLDYHYFDKTLMSQVAQEMGISEAEVVDFSEDSYKVRGFVDALLRRSTPVATSTVWTSTAKGEEAKVGATLDEETAARFEATIIKGLRERGNIVVVGRGGQAVLRDEPGVLHVRIIAGREDRVPRLIEQHRISRHAAIEMMGERDHATAEYLQRFYNVDWADPLLYHLILNTSKLGIEGAAQVIVAAAHHMEAQLKR
jgi:CMP/dCMP kinase